MGVVTRRRNVWAAGAHSFARITKGPDLRLVANRSDVLFCALMLLSPHYDVIPWRRMKEASQLCQNNPILKEPRNLTVNVSFSETTDRRGHTFSPGSQYSAMYLAQKLSTCTLSCPDRTKDGLSFARQELRLSVPQRTLFAKHEICGGTENFSIVANQKSRACVETVHC